jgi:hypothetical protein
MNPSKISHITKDATFFFGQHSKGGGGIAIEILVLERVHMFKLLLQTFWAKKPCKKSADLHPRQGNLLHYLEHLASPVGDP